MIILLIRIGFVDDLAWDLPEGYGRNGEDVEGGIFSSAPPAKQWVFPGSL